jgi:hypothetical protein
METISYHPFDRYYLKYNTKNLTVSQFVNLCINDIDNLPILNLDSNYYNVLTLKKNIINNITTDKPIKYYHLIVNNKNNILHNSECAIMKMIVNGNFDLIIISDNINKDIVGYLSNRFKCDILHYDKNLEKYKEKELSKYNFKVKDNDILLSDILPYINQINELIKAITDAYDIYIDNIKRSFTLNKDKINILVLCATTESIIIEKFKRIIYKTIGDCNYDNTSIYYIGKHIYIENDNILRCTINGLSLGDKSAKFDIIISEHCPFPAFYNAYEKLYNILNDDGYIISPNYKTDNNIEFSNLFENYYNNRDYVIYKKIN